MHKEWNTCETCVNSEILKSVVFLVCSLLRFEYLNTEGLAAARGASAAETCHVSREDVRVESCVLRETERAGPAPGCGVRGVTMWAK